ncbi:MAG: SIMPL domain-containing protein [Thermomicrobiales bacterium]
MFEPADCVTLLQEARDAAIADAQQRAEGLAASLGGTLGSLIQASETPFYGAAGNTSCDPAGEVYGPYGPGTLPAFDPRAAEAEVHLQVTLTYALELGA